MPDLPHCLNCDGSFHDHNPDDRTACPEWSPSTQVESYRQKHGIAWDEVRDA